MSDLLCLGLGYCAERLAGRLAGEGWAITGTTREAGKRARGAARGWRIIDPGEGESLARALASASYILVSAPPARGGGEDPFLPIAREILPRRDAAPVWIGYLSTTGVYGVSDGSLVDEATPATPLLPRTRARLEAERGWAALGAAIAAPLAVFRLAGIYGPGRNAIEQLRAGTARRIVKPRQVFNRIHVDDVAVALLASLRHPAADGIYNVADDMPAPPQDVVAHAARLLGVPPPPEIAFKDADLSPMARSFYEENKRVDNRRLKARLGVHLAYPDYRAGLAAILSELQQ